VTIRSVDELGTVLGVWAHPDDEAYLSAGIMALAVEGGARVVCVTATKGESGSPDPERWPPAAMADIRERELNECLAVLGVEEHRWLGYVDGTCDRVDVDHAATDIVAIIDEVQPDTVLTFGPDGFTDHGDHRAVSVWVTEAHRRAALRGSRARLHYATQTAGWIDEIAPPWRDLGAFPPSFPLATPDDRLSIEIELPAASKAQKVRALLAQASQTAEVRARLGVDLYDCSFDVERYRSP
jgi:LmbE family N-acetylglucosaminyl deacetylase